MDLDKLDSFASLFRSAVKEPFSHEKIRMEKILLVDDNPLEKAEKLMERLKGFLKKVTAQDNPQWKILSGKDFDSISELIEKCKEEAPSLIVTYRHLKQKNKNLPYSIGVYLDMLTQATPYPILVLPYLPDKQEYEKVLENTNSVTVIADHITGDHRLINYGLYFAEEEGALYITHVENNRAFKRYMEVIGKIPEIPTERSIEKIREQLLKEPQDYINSCIEKLKEENLKIQIRPHVKMGHSISEYKNLILDRRVDLLIMNTKDQDQLAMHGMAYSLAVELKQIPLLLL